MGGIGWEGWSEMGSVGRSRERRDGKMGRVVWGREGKEEKGGM